MSLQRFEQCLAITLSDAFEGGFSDDPDDPGGATNHGIEFTEWNAWKQAHGEPPSTLEQFKNDLTPLDVEPIYLHNYWEPINDGTLPTPADFVIFDTCVLEGIGKAQRMKNYLSFLTLELDDTKRALALCNWRDSDFRTIVALHNGLNKFLPGWLGRVQSCRDLINAGKI